MSSTAPAEEQSATALRPAATRNGVAYVSPEARELLVRARAEQGRTMGELVLMALNAQHGRLQELLEQRRPQVVDGPLFAVATKPPRATLTMITLRISQAHWDVIDRLVLEYAAANRGELIDAALQAEFGERR